MAELSFIFAATSIAFIPGAIGFVCQLFWPLLRSRRAILSMQSGIGLGYGTQYALLDAWSGASVAWLGGGQTLLILLVGSKHQKTVALCAFPLLAIAVVLTWSGLPSMFAAVACTLMMLSRLCRDTLHLRALQLLAAPFGMAYDISAAAVPALCGCIVSTAIAAFAFRRELCVRMPLGFSGSRQALTRAILGS